MLSRSICRFVGRLGLPSAAIACALALGDPPTQAAAADACGSVPLLAITTGASDIPSPCAVAPGQIVLESLYYQNASLVGGTALAAYPMLNIRTGIVPRVEAVFEPPSQVAESGLRGAGLYPSSHSSYGLDYTFDERTRSAWSAGFEIIPPASPYAPSETQPKYRFDVISDYTLSSAVTLKASVAASTSHAAGFGTILPAGAIGAQLSPTARTMFSVDIGARLVTRRASAQGFGDISLSRLFARRVAWNVGLGTAFNSVANAKAHYLSTGL